MVELIGGEVASSSTLDALGLDAMPSPGSDVAGSSIGSGFWNSLAPRLMRLAPGFTPSSSLLTMQEEQAQPDPGPTLSPEDAQRQYGMPGLTFSHPLSQMAAESMHEARRAQIVREDTISRRPESIFTGQAAQFAYGLVGGLMDPLNLAAAAVPGVGEARLLGAFGEGLGGRIAARVISGATAGAAGMAALEPLNYALDQAEGHDWSMAETLRNIGLGAVLGGGLHVVAGAVGDGLRTPAPVRERLEAAGPEARETLLRGAVGQIMDDRPVTAGPALDALDGAGVEGRIGEWETARETVAAAVAQREAALSELYTAREARNRGEAPAALAGYDTPQAVDAAIRPQEAALEAARGRLAVVERGLDDLRQGRDPTYALRYADPDMNRRVSAEPPGDMPQTLLGRIRELGGLRDSGGELAARDLDKTPGMVRPNGMPVEQAAVRLAEEGYLPELSRDMAGHGPEQVDRIGALLEAIDEQRSGRPRLREQDVPEWDAKTQAHEQAKAALSVAAEHLGLTEAQARGLSRGQLGDVLADRRSRDETYASHDLPGTEEPEPYHPPGEGLSLEDAQRHWNTSLDALRSGVDAADAERSAVAAAADRASKAGNAKLADVQWQIEQLQKQLGIEPEPKEPEMAAAEQGVEDAEIEANAVDAAASCLKRSGI